MTDLTPLLISGAPRSGTSLLYNLFDGHPEVTWLVNEGYLFEYLADLGPARAHLFEEALPTDLDALIAGLRDKQVMPPMHKDYTQSLARGSVSEVHIASPWSEERFRAALAAPRGRGMSALWRWLAAAYAAGEGQPPRRYAVMKSPDFAKSIASSLTLLPEARGLVILRDPLRALDSLKRSRELRGEKLVTWPQLALAVGSFLDMADRLEAADPARLVVLRYEDLTAEPERCMRDVADWLGLTYAPSLLQPTMRGQHWPGISSFKPTDGIETGPADRPLQALAPEEADYVRAALSGFRERYGYRD